MSALRRLLDVPTPADPLATMLVAGEVLRSATGKITTPFPKVDFATERKAQNTLRRVDAWLIENATREAFARGNHTRARVIAQYRPGSLSLADKDELCLCLFDAELAALEREYGHVRMHIGNPVNPAPFKPLSRSLWLLNYTTHPEIGRTTRIRAFSTRQLAQAFAEQAGAHGYLLRAWDIGTLGEADQRAITRFETWVGQFTPSAGEAARIEAAVELPIEALAS